MDTPQTFDALPLFPLNTVLFPGGHLALKVFEARYLDLMGRCLRSAEPFGVVALLQGAEVGAEEPRLEMAACGVLARIDDVDAEQAGILLVRCTGLQRFRLLEAPSQQPGGLWTARALREADDDPAPVEPALAGTAEGLSRLAARLEAKGQPLPWKGPAQLDDAGWVANRWCELLPVPVATRQKLLELDDATARLRLVDEFLRSRGILQG
jgi:Lon protease-like protein